MEGVEDLPARFRECFASWGGNLEQMREKLFSAYASPSRYYHNLEHISALLRALDGTGITDAEVETAIWFHDVVYDTHRRDNELRSAEWYKTHALREKRFSERVYRLILATAPGQECSGLVGESLIKDLDLSILGSGEEEYEEYALKIREEYRWVGEEEYAVGRGQVLRSFLEKPLYQTVFFIPLEERARQNLLRELARY